MSEIDINDRYKEFLKKLDSKKLANLVADILSIKGHTNIRIVDETGDGCRTIYSTTKEGNKHVTQCKYNKDIEKKLDSCEIGELLLTKEKCRYKKGLVVTNVRISSQVKKEFLDNYSECEIDFMSGTDLVREVFNNSILRSIWYNNNSFDKSSYTVLIPFISRNLLLDKYYKLLPDEKEEVFKYELKTDTRTKSIEIRIKRSWYDKDVFEPYRIPSIRTFSERWGARIYAYKASISGIEILDDIISIYNLFKQSLVDIVVNKFGDKSYSIAIRFGKQYISLLDGSSMDSHIELPFKQETIFIQDNQLYNEYNFILPTSKVNWKRPTIVQAEQWLWTRWYNPNLDICLNLAIKSIPNIYPFKCIEEQKDNIKRYWSRSLFALVPKKLINNDILKIYEPSKKFDWSSDEYLCAWLQPSLLSDFTPEYMQVDEDGLAIEEDSLLKEFDMSIVKDNISSLDVKLIDSSKARLMFVVVDEDPYPMIEEKWYTPADMICKFDDIPSPISPSSRIFQFNVCWKQLAKKMYTKSIEKLDVIINDYLSSCKINSICNISYDSDKITKENYIIIDLFLDMDNKFERTDNVLNSIYNYLINMLHDIEILISKECGKIVRTTKDYWFNKIGMVFME